MLRETFDDFVWFLLLMNSVATYNNNFYIKWWCIQTMAIKIRNKRGVRAHCHHCHLSNAIRWKKKEIDIINTGKKRTRKTFIGDMLEYLENSRYATKKNLSDT